MKQLSVPIISQTRVVGEYYTLRVRSSYLARVARAGQFIEVRCATPDQALLRRPLGVHRILPDGIELLYEVVGIGTKLLSRRVKGDMLDVIGPLGNGFDIRMSDRTRDQAIIIAGGIGVAPLVALAESLRARISRQSLHVFVGARTRAQLLGTAAFKKASAHVVAATDDGSVGHRGFVSEAADIFLRSTDIAKRSTIYACGPHAMLKSVSALTRRYNIPCQVSLEEHMACGVGVCLGCPVRIRQDRGAPVYKMVCKDGPVFDGAQVVW